MANRMYTKKQLTIIEGMLVSPAHEVVQPDPEIIEQANALETLSQKVAYLVKQPAATPMPSLDGFHRKSVDDDLIPEFEVSTPVLDRKALEAMAMMDEIDDTNTAAEANAMLGCFSKLIAFAKSEYVLDTGTPGPRIDTPTLGNLLELTVDGIVDVVASACGLSAIDNDADDLDKDVAEVKQMLDDLLKAESEGRLEVMKPTSELMHSVSDAIDKFVEDNKD